MNISVKYKCQRGRCECEYDDILIDEFKTEDDFLNWLDKDEYDTCINCGFDTAKIVDYEIREELKDNDKTNENN